MVGFVDSSFPLQLGVPQWMIVALRTLGFALHAAFMGLWYAGIPLAVAMARSPDIRLRQISRRLMLQMPVIVAFGVNLGIVPLLFLQTGFASEVYSATILIGWFWLAIIALLIFAYYGVYLYGWDGIPADRPITGWRLVVGIIAAACFVAIGFLFANGFSFIFRQDRWPELWQRAQVAGAATGLTLNVDDPLFWPRWLFVFALALQTTACWFLLDAAVFRREATLEDQLVAARWARRLYLAGFAGALVFGGWHFANLSKIAPIFGDALWSAGAVVALAVGAIMSVMLIRKAGRAEALSGRFAWICVGLHVLYLIVVGFLRIWADLQGMANADQFWSRPVAMQWSPFFLFVVTLIVGISVVSWMLIQVVRHLGPANEEGG